MPVSAKDNMQTLKAFNQIFCDYPRRNYYNENALCLAFAARSIGLKQEFSLPGVSQTNGIAEVNNRIIIASTRKLLAQAGLPACWWPYASPTYCFQHNALLDLDNQSGYYEQHGSHFPGEMFPFGCIVYYMVSPTRDGRDKTEPALRTGIFMGYRTPPGGLWQGDYLVADIDDFSGLSLHTHAEPALFAKVRPHITRTVKCTPHQVRFPLLERYVQHNETIEGIEEALLQATIQRNRRKGRKRPEMTEGAEKRMREFAQSRPVPLVPETAGYDKALVDPVTPKATTTPSNEVLPTIIPLEASDTATDAIM